MSQAFSTLAVSKLDVEMARNAGRRRRRLETVSALYSDGWSLPDAIRLGTLLSERGDR